MTESAIQVDGLTKSFGSVRAVAGLSVTVRSGETVALLGPNGAGKSTTISMLLGLARPDSGEVRVFGASPAAAMSAGQVGAMLQGGELPGMVKVRELVELARAVYPRPLAAAAVLATAGLTHLAGWRVDRLSGGLAQRARFAFALAGDPDLLVLDEPTAGMDAASRQSFWTTMRRRATSQRTILFATHYLAEADEFADRIIVLDHGRLVADGSAAEIKQRVSGRRVSFALDGGPTTGLDQLPGVRRFEVRGDRVVLITDDADRTVQVLLQTRGSVRDLEVTGADLTAAFLALTGVDKGES